MDPEDKQAPERDNVETTDSSVKERAQSEQPDSTFTASDVQGIVQAAVEAALKQFQQNTPIPKSNEYQQTLIKHVANAQSNLMVPSGIEEMNQKIDYVKKVVADDQLRRRLDDNGRSRYGQQGEDFLKAKIVLLKHRGATDEQIAEWLL